MMYTFEVRHERGTAGVDEQSVYAVTVEAASAREAIEIVVNSSEARIDGSDFGDWEWRESANQPILAHPDTDQAGRYGDYWMAMEIQNENMNDVTAPKLRIATYAQQCGLRGQWVRTWDGETESADYHVHEGTREELLAEADRWEASGRKIGAGEGLYRQRMAEAIREAVS